MIMESRLYVHWRATYRWTTWTRGRSLARAQFTAPIMGAQTMITMHIMLTWKSSERWLYPVRNLRAMSSAHPVVSPARCTMEKTKSSRTFELPHFKPKEKEKKKRVIYIFIWLLFLSNLGIWVFVVTLEDLSLIDLFRFSNMDINVY